MVDEETWYRNNKAVTELENNVDYIRVDSLKAKLTRINKTTNKVYAID